MDLISKDLALNADEEEKIDGIEEMEEPDEFKEEDFPSEEGEDM